ncbi:MAG TPA: hypothetical protein DEB40_14350 [Elusimicrobia bacterium]|nr:hypothetical protein [Elusimicrobiota bacterium]HBT62914.1 hypothetical protein [Elusimicrobiota bacterium]
MPGRDGTGPRRGGGLGGGKRGRGGGCGRRAGQGRSSGIGCGGSQGVSAELLKQAHNRNAACVDLEKCTGCGVCEEVCPAKAIVVGDTARVDLVLCTGCGTCIPECPNAALTLKRVAAEKE